jgi:hypothetical protein
MSPAESAPVAVLRWFKAVDKAIEEEDTSKLVDTSFQAVGYLTKLPMNQIVISGHGIYDWMTDDPDFEVRDLFFRKRDK